MSDLINAAAHAFALVCFADGQLSVQEQRFQSFAAKDPALASYGRSEIIAAWQKAVSGVQKDTAFAKALAAIRAMITNTEDSAVVMRAAQAAMVADGRIEQQENAAIRSIAEVLQLNPDDY